LYKEIVLEACAYPNTATSKRDFTMPIPSTSVYTNWMLVNFDCTGMWVKDANILVNCFNVDRIYLAHQFQGQSRAPDYRHWQLALGRRFRSLKVWIVLRTYGQEKIREFLRHYINFAKHFEGLAKADDRFEVKRTELGLVCFRIKGDCNQNPVMDIRNYPKSFFGNHSTSWHGFDPRDGKFIFLLFYRI
jgi:hypothetical protein